MSEQSLILTEQVGSVFKITINRPKYLNALNEEVLSRLDEALDSAPKNTRIIALYGAGDKAFVAGADIAKMSDMNSEQAEKFAVHGQKVFRKLELLPTYVVAVVDGYALGGGCELALACDSIIATNNAKFGQPEVHLGLTPGFGGTQRLVHKIGYGKGTEMLLTGNPINSDEALRLGLVNYVCEDKEECDRILERMAKGINKASPDALAKTKKLAQMSRDIDLEKGMIEEASAFSKCFDQKDAHVGISAFLNKESAPFTYKP